jgi:hypothetical protein
MVFGVLMIPFVPGNVPVSSVDGQPATGISNLSKTARALSMYSRAFRPFLSARATRALISQANARRLGSETESADSKSFDDDNNAGTPFGAGQAANLTADRITTPGAGFFIYFNQALDLPRLVFSTDLSDSTADLKVLARMLNLNGANRFDAFLVLRCQHPVARSRLSRAAEKQNRRLFRMTRPTSCRRDRE